MKWPRGEYFWSIVDKRTRNVVSSGRSTSKEALSHLVVALESACIRAQTAPVELDVTIGHNGASGVGYDT